MVSPTDDIKVRRFGSSPRHIRAVTKVAKRAKTCNKQYQKITFTVISNLQELIKGGGIKVGGIGNLSRMNKWGGVGLFGNRELRSNRMRCCPIYRVLAPESRRS